MERAQIIRGMLRVKIDGREIPMSSLDVEASPPVEEDYAQGFTLRLDDQAFKVLPSEPGKTNGEILREWVEKTYSRFGAPQVLLVHPAVKAKYEYAQKYHRWHCPVEPQRGVYRKRWVRLRRNVHGCRRPWW